MGRRGPKPIPEATKKKINMRVRTKARPRQIDLQPLKDLTAPSFLSPLAKKEWERVAPLLKKAKLLTVADVTALAGYCQSWAEFVHTTRVIRKKGMVYESKSGHGVTLKQRPEVGIRQKAAVSVLRYCVEFGFTPSSRGRMQITDDGSRKKQPDALEAMLQESEGESNGKD